FLKWQNCLQMTSSFSNFAGCIRNITNRQNLVGLNHAYNLIMKSEYSLEILLNLSHEFLKLLWIGWFLRSGLWQDRHRRVVWVLGRKLVFRTQERRLSIQAFSRLMLRNDLS